MIHKPFDIVIVPFPFADEMKRYKYRPALVVSSKEYNQKTHCLTLAMITSAKKSDFWGDCTITDYKSTDLQNGCIVRMKFFTIDAILIKAKIGSLGKRDVGKIRKNLKLVLNS